MKQIILPIILPVLLVLALKVFAPQMQAAAIFLLAILAILAGVVLSAVIFKAEDSDEQKNKTV